MPFPFDPPEPNKPAARWWSLVLTIVLILMLIAAALGPKVSKAGAAASVRRCDGARSWYVKRTRTTYSFCRSRNPGVFSVYGTASTLGNKLTLHLVCGSRSLNAQFIVGKRFEKSATLISASQKQRDMYQLMRASAECSLTVGLTQPKAASFRSQFRIWWNQRATLTTA